MLRPLLVTWYACAQRLGDVELSIRLLIEMLGHGKSPRHLSTNFKLIPNFISDAPDSDDPSSLEEDVIAVLKVSSSGL
jgi:hypothetical protein